LEEGVEVAKELITGLLEKMEVHTVLEGFLREGDVYLEVKGDEKGILIGKHGRTLDAVQFLINRMVNKRLKEPSRVVLDVNDYRKRRAEHLKMMALQLGERAKVRGHSLTIGPFSAHDRRIIHITLKEDPFLRTDSLGEGEMKRIKIIPRQKEMGKA
jgi:spoIIIJ-associated protein